MRELCRQDNAWTFNDTEMKRLNINYEGKGVLALRADLWFPYSDNVKNVSDISIAYYTKGNSNPFFLKKILVGRPYPNKGIVSAVTRVGRKQTKEFIPIVFDSLDELYKVERIEIIWNLNNSEFVVVNYPISFAESKQKGVYCLQTYDVPCSVIAQNEDEFKIEDGKIVSEHSSLYDDVCFFDIENDKVEIIGEVHTPESKFDIERFMANSIFPRISLVMLRHESEIKKEFFSSKAFVVYYSVNNIVLSDDGVFP